MVYYRKYRPQKIHDLDSEAVRVSLTATLQSVAPTYINVPHAFLFTGPKGLGKTSTARIVAKVINCTGRKSKDNKDIEPCETCDQCISITSGTNLDVLEIDAASNRGIDEIRDLRDKIRLAPVLASKKVYIIDEVHMLTTEAFNALLKTLEEPPAHAVFILCTTESHKVPATVLSRCLHIAFKKATEKELVRAFERIIKGEKLTVDPSVLSAIAKISDGGFRDGTKILEEVVASAAGRDITQALFDDLYKVSGVSGRLDEFFVSLFEKDTKKAIDTIQSFSEDGISMDYILSEILKKIENSIASKVGTEQTEKGLSLNDLVLLGNIFSKAASEMRTASVSSLPILIAIIRFCEGETSSFPPVLNASPNPVATIKTTAEEVVTVSSLRRQSGNMAKERAVSGEVEVEVRKEKTDPADVSVLKYAATGDHSQEWMDNLWKNIILEMKNHNHMIAGVLRSCRMIGFDRKTMLIEASSKFHKERLDDPKTFEVLHVVSHKLIGNPIEISIQLRK